MNSPTWIRRLVSRSISRRLRKTPHRRRLTIMSLEDRSVPAVFTVLNANDTGAGSLRQAVADANATIGADDIVFGDGSGSGGTNFLDATPDTILLSSGAITFAGDTALTRVIGTGANLLTVSGGNTQGVFWVNSGILTSISGMTITGGNSASTGGGVNSFGTLTLADCSISGNTSTGRGGGIYSSTALTMTNCTVSGNTAGGTFRYGGGVFAFGTASLSNCTVAGNSGDTGGGVQKGNNATMTLTNCTISGNSADTNGGGVKASTGGSITIQNTIVASNTSPAGPDVYSLVTVSSLGNNLIGKTDNSTGWIGSDLTGTVALPLDPQLAALADNGGPTRTMALLPNSPAINAGIAINPTDQRGFARFGNSDIGAFEYQFKVTNSNDSGVGSLRQAIGNANTAPSADTVVFASLFNTARTITLTTGQIDLTDAALTTIAGPGSNLLTVSGNNASRIFNVNLGASAAMSGMRLTAGRVNGTLLTAASAGAAVYNAGVLSISDLIASGNSANGGGGGGFGGAIHSQGDTTLDNVTASNNTGTGINSGNGSGTLTLINCTMSGNTLSGLQVGGGFARVTDSTISGNSRQGVNAYVTQLTMNNVTISGNTSTVDDGAGISIGLGSASLTNCTITGNNANSRNGGGVSLRGTATFTNCTISGNSAAIGGGFNVFSGTPTFVNTIIAGNTATNRGPDVGGTSNNPQSVTSLGNNLIGKTDASTGWLVSDLTGTVASPLNPQLAALAPNVAAPPTMALLPNSPAINAGNSANVRAEVQIVTVTGTSGTFTLTFDGQTTPTPIAFNAAQGTVQTALNNLSSIGGVGGSVAVVKTGNVYTITFGGTLATQNVSQITGAGTGGATVSTATLGQGYTAANGQVRFGNTDIGAYEYLFKVTNTADNINLGTLRRAIFNANTSVGADTVVFRIGTGTQTITPNSAFDALVDGTSIDGTSQGGYSGTPLIEISGVSAGNVDGLTITGAGSTIRGLVVNRFGQAGILIEGTSATGNTITGNFIGTDVTGMSDLGNTRDGINVRFGAKNNIIGGVTPGAGNLISGNDEHGITLRNNGTQGNLVVGNLIGVNRTATAVLGNTQSGMTINVGADANTIGGTTEGARNVISGNGRGIYIVDSGSHSNTILGNYIGTTAAGIAVGNGGEGILFDGDVSGNTIGGTVAGAGNVIAFNGNNGLVLLGTSADNNTFRQNSFFANIGQAIDVGNDGRTLNTLGAPLNYPVLTRVRTGVGVIEVEGFAQAGRTIEFYVADSNTSGFNSGRTYLATATEGSPADSDATAGSYGPTVNGIPVGSDTANRFHFTIPVPADFVPGKDVTALTIGSVSEFGASVNADISQAFGAPVVDAGPDATLVVGQTFSGRGSFSDIDSDSWTAEVNYGDSATWYPLALDPPAYSDANGDGFTIAATVGFALNHTYATPNDYFVTVRVKDDSNTIGSDALLVHVGNAPPVIDNSHITVTPQRIAEGGMVTVNGTFSDASTGDSHTVSIIWGDGSASPAVVNEAARTFTATHVYRDDNLPNTAAEAYPLQAIITDGAGATATSTVGLFFVEVDNVQPSALTLTTSPTTIDEGGTILLSGSFTDPGVEDTHRVVITWGDGSPNTIVELPAGVTSFTDVPHQYVNNPTAAATAYTLGVAVTDDDEPLNPVTAQSTVTVSNVAPSNVIVSPSLPSIVENGTINLSGSFTDPGSLDAHTVAINWGDGSSDKVLNLAAGVTSFSGISHRYLDNPNGYPNGSFSITVTVADTDQPAMTATGSSNVTVSNANPSVIGLTLSSTSILENSTIVVNGSIGDVGTLDSHTVAINWGDGITTSATVDNTTRTFTASHLYRDDNPTGTGSDVYTITATAQDDDLGQGSASLSLTVGNEAPTVRILPGPNNSAASVHLISEVIDRSPLDTFSYQWSVAGGAVTPVTGTGPDFTFTSSASTAYTVTLTVTDDDGGTTTSSTVVNVLTDAPDTYTPTANPAGASSLIVLGLGGSDTINASNLSIPVILDGGADTDVLTGGSADDVVILHQGNDSGFGGGGNDNYKLTPNSTLTIEDGFGANTLDFGTATFGITFDLSASDGTLQNVQPTTSLHYVSIDDLGTGKFGTLIGSDFGDNLTAASDSTLYGDAGADKFVVKTDTVNSKLFGGADGDQLLATGTGITTIDFHGDDGADLFTNIGTIGVISFGGGSDGDELLNSGAITKIDFLGDDGVDLLTNIGTIGTITFGGGSDGDQLENTGTVLTKIDFLGDDGVDLLTNTGTVGVIKFGGGSDGDQLLATSTSQITSISFNGDDGVDLLTNAGSVGTISFGGGSDGDQLENTGTVLTKIDFLGDDGVDLLTNAGSVGTINFGGGSDGDELLNTGTVATAIVFNGDDGVDLLTNAGTVSTINFGGGSDGDELENRGTVLTTILFNGDDGVDALTNIGTVGTITFGGGSDGDLLQTNAGSVATTIVFNGDDGADMLLNAGSVTTITFTGGSDGDLLQNNGTNVTTIVFNGDDGVDTLTNVGTVGTITFTGGSDGDLLQTATGSVATTIVFNGDDGVDALTNLGDVGTITFGGGSDGDLLQNAGTVATAIDFHGDDGVDTLTNVGTIGTITFGGGSDGDLLQTSGTSVATTIVFNGDAGEDKLVNYGAATTITFNGGLDKDKFGNFANDVSKLSFIGDDGVDLLVNEGNNVTTITFNGGSDGDLFLNTGTGVTKIDFTGDDGVDMLQNDGSVAIINFGGGSDGDEFLNNGTGVSTIVFNGDDGADVFVNNGNGNVATTITFTGGSDGDAFQNNASLVGKIVFEGDDGVDVFHNDGSTVTTITFTGGSDGDYLQNTGANVATIDFHGDDGADMLLSTGANVAKIDFHGDDGVDTLVNTGTGVANITFTGGSDGDELENRGTLVSTIVFNGDDGVDTLTNIGTVGTITFGGGSDGDLLQTSGSSTATTIVFNGDDGVDQLVNFGATTTITFAGGADGDYLQNSGAVATKIEFNGDDGVDQLVNLGTSNVANIVFTGGSDGDEFWNLGTGLAKATFNGDDGADSLVNDGTVVTTIVFNGDDGADMLTNNGSISTITFTGGSDGDLLQNTGTATTITFGGGSDGDTLTNAGTVTTITFAGGSDGDMLQTTTGSTATSIVFNGDDGADLLTNAGTVSTITFTGGSDGDVLQNGGTVATAIDFHGDDGADTLIDSGTGSPATTIVFTGGADDDLFIKRGQGSSTTFNGGIGNDRVLISGSGNVTIVGGAGSDSYYFAGVPQGSVSIQDDYVAGDASIDSLDFAELSTGGVSVDLSRTTSQTVATGLSLTLSSNRGIENVVGTAFGDNLIGNDQNNVLDGAALRDDRVTVGPGWDGVTQWVYLDFDAETDLDEHVYTQAERDAIQQRIQSDYTGPDAQNPWFHVALTQNLNDIPSTLRTTNQYATLFFNRTPSFNRPGGEASELDFRNTNLGGTASIQVNGLTGGANQPTTTSDNIVALASKIGAHELAHLMGVRHADAFGPIGYGLHSPPGNDTFKPTFGGAEGAFETFSHLIGSPATVGSDRFNDLNDLYFGEREAVKLSFAERGTVAVEQVSSHGTTATAQPLTLATLSVPNTVQGLHTGSTFDVAALAVTGHIGLSGAHSESDFYSFSGRRGDILSIEVLSVGLGQRASGTIDSVLKLYDSAGNLVPYYGGLAMNDDQFEPTDSLLFDVMLPSDGTYYIEVDTFARSPSDPLYDTSDPNSPINPANTASVLNPLNPDFDQARLDAFNDTRNDTDTGDYELFLYRFATANPVDAGDNIQGGAGDDTIKGGMGGDSLSGGLGADFIDMGDGTTPQSPPELSVNETDVVSVPLAVSSNQSITWRVAASNGQVISNGSGSSFSFVPNDSGICTVSYTVVGSEGDTTSDDVTVNVLNVAPTANVSNGGAVNEGQTGSVSLSGQADPSAADLSSLRYSYDFNNDGTFDLGDGTYLGSVTASSATVPASYLSNGPFNRVVRARVIDKDDGYTDAFTTIVVNNVGPTVNVGGNAVLLTPTLSRIGSFTDPGADSWTATVDYGDGSGVQPLTLNADKTFALNHTYAEMGNTFTVTVTVSDGTTTGSASFLAVDNVPAEIEAGPNQTANEGSAVSLTAATFTNPYSTGAHTATINWGDGTGEIAGSVSQSTSGSGGVGTISGNHRYADDGTYTVTVTVTTATGATSSDTFTVTVNNVAPTLAPLSGPAIVIPGQPLTYSANFSDPGFDNPLNTGEVVETFSGTINWGDGTSTEAATVTSTTGSPGVLSTGSASKGHIYAAPGNYTITLTVNDDDSGTAARTLLVKVTDSAYLLATSGSEVLSVSGNGRVTLPGVIEVNSNSATAIKASGNGQISATQIHVVGGYNRSGNATISATPVTGSALVADPFGSLAVPSVAGAIGSVNLTGNSSLSISPGRYSQIKVSGNATLTMLPGVYVIVGGGMSITGSGNVIGHGVMIYNAGSNYPSTGGNFGGIAVTGNGTIDLTAPAVNSPYAGVLFFQSRDNTRALALSGSGLLGIHGSIYAKAAQVALSGNAELKASLVVQSMTVSGNAVSTLLVEGDIGADSLPKTLLGADLWVYVDNVDGAFQADTLSRIDATIAGLNALLGSHGVFINLVNTVGEANLVLDAATNSPLGGMNQGILGFYSDVGERSEITLIQGWDWYEGADPAAVGFNQFDFQTIVTHELGHAVGLGHNGDASSVMHSDLSAGTSKRTMSETDLNIPDAGDEGDPLMAAGYRSEEVLQPLLTMPVMVRTLTGSLTPPIVTGLNFNNADIQGIGNFGLNISEAVLISDDRYDRVQGIWTQNLSLTTKSMPLEVAIANGLVNTRVSAENRQSGVGTDDNSGNGAFGEDENLVL